MDASELTTALYLAASDHEADVLDAIRAKAGLTWECYGTDEKPCRWTNDKDDATCGRCSAAKGSTEEA